MLNFRTHKLYSGDLSQNIFIIQYVVEMTRNLYSWDLSTSFSFQFHLLISTYLVHLQLHIRLTKNFENILQSMISSTCLISLMSSPWPGFSCVITPHLSCSSLQQSAPDQRTVAVLELEKRGEMREMWMVGEMWEGVWGLQREQNFLVLSGSDWS